MATASDPSRLDRFIGLKRDSREPWIARYAAHIRIALPLIALAVVLAGIVIPMFGEATGIMVRQMPERSSRGEYMRMERPHFAASDSTRRPYTLTADYAVQKTRDLKVYELARPKADLLDKKGRWIAVTADHGRYDQQLRMLDLGGEVTLFQDQGYTIATDQARIDLEAHAAWGDRPVRGHGPDGEIEAQGFHASEGGDRLVFTGRTRLVLNGHVEPPDPAAAPGPEPPPPGG